MSMKNKEKHLRSESKKSCKPVCEMGWHGTENITKTSLLLRIAA